MFAAILQPKHLYFGIFSCFCMRGGVGKAVRTTKNYKNNGTWYDADD